MTYLSIATTLLVAPKPTTNCDPIGIAKRDRDGRITMQLRSVQCDGTLAESQIKVEPTDRTYVETLSWLDGIDPNETKIIIAKGLQPCPKPATGSKEHKR